MHLQSAVGKDNLKRSPSVGGMRSPSVWKLFMNLCALLAKAFLFVMFPFTCPFMAVLADADLFPSVFLVDRHERTSKWQDKKPMANGVSVFLSDLSDVLLESNEVASILPEYYSCLVSLMLK